MHQNFSFQAFSAVVAEFLTNHSYFLLLLLFLFVCVVGWFSCFLITEDALCKYDPRQFGSKVELIYFFLCHDIPQSFLNHFTHKPWLF